MKIATTEDLNAIFTELTTTDKFKAKIAQVLKLGYIFDVEVKEPLKCFTAKSGKQYKVRVAYNGYATYLKRTYIKRGSVGMDFYNSCPEIFTKIEATPNGHVKVADAEFDTYAAEYETADDTSWAEIGRCIGKLIKDEFVGVCTCSKCGGTGVLPQFAYYADGVCFECLGVGKWLAVK